MVNTSEAVHLPLAFATMRRCRYPLESMVTLAGSPWATPAMPPLVTFPRVSGPGDGLGLECGKRREQCGGEDREGEDGFWHFHDFAIALC